MPEKFDFPRDRGLQTRSTIIVPSTKDIDKPISEKEFQGRINDTRRFLNAKFGGSTSVRGVGSFTDAKGRLVKERVALVEHFTTFKDWKKQDAAVKKFLEKKQKQWGQEAIGFEFEAPTKRSRLLFIEAPKMEKRKMKQVS